MEDHSTHLQAHTCAHSAAMPPFTIVIVSGTRPIWPAGQHKPSTCGNMPSIKSRTRAQLSAYQYSQH
jgi:hypothetical protein